MFFIGLWCNGSTRHFDCRGLGSSPDSLVLFLYKKLERMWIEVDYIIVSPSRKQYIRIDADGRPITCGKNQMQRFEYSKAKNLLKNLPKTMKKFHFKVEAVSEIEHSVQEKVNSMCNNKDTSDNSESAESVYLHQEWKMTPQVQVWIDRSNQCHGLISDAEIRKTELIEKLSNVDRELSNCIHKIEIERNMNACAGYMEYKRERTILRRRREIKDELAIVDSIITCNIDNLAPGNIDKMVERLKHRRFRIRDVDLDDIYIDDEFDVEDNIQEHK